MKFSESYPNLNAWATYSGEVTMFEGADGKVTISLADAGGVPEDGKVSALSLDEALDAAELKCRDWREETKKLQDGFLSEQVPERDEDEFIRVAGWPPKKNPFYKNK